MASRADFVTRYRRAVTNMLAAIDQELRGLDYQYEALSYLTELDDADVTESGADFTAAEFHAAVASVSTLRNSFHTGAHDTNLYRIHN